MGLSWSGTSAGMSRILVLDSRSLFLQAAQQEFSIFASSPMQQLTVLDHFCASRKAALRQVSPSSQLIHPKHLFDIHPNLLFYFAL